MIKQCCYCWIHRKSSPDYLYFQVCKWTQYTYCQLSQ